jgi:hypothetical protein
MAADRADIATDHWTVVRLDDNGNEFEVARGLSQSAAQKFVEQLESTAHKQHYWIREERGEG